MLTLARALVGSALAILGIVGGFVALFTWGPGIGLSVMLLVNGLAALVMPDIQD